MGRALLTLSLLHGALLAATGITPNPACAADGDIIIEREVQARVATRAPLVSDPNPRVVNPGATSRDLAVEMTDGDFASVSTGMALPDRSVQNQVVNNPAMSGSPTHPALSAGGAVHTGGSAGRAISGQVNQSIQQGLRPLLAPGGR